MPKVENVKKSFTITEKGKQLIQETEDIYQEIIGKMKVIISDEEMKSEKNAVGIIAKSNATPAVSPKLI